MVRLSDEISLDFREEPEPALFLNGLLFCQAERKNGLFSLFFRAPAASDIYFSVRNAENGEEVLRQIAPDAKKWLPMYSLHLKKMKNFHNLINEQAEGRFINSTVCEKLSVTGFINIPETPFHRWALGDGNRHLWPEWKNVCSRGMRILNDDPNHSDWIVGSGLDPLIHYSLNSRKGSPDALLSERAYDIMWEVQHKLLGFQCAVLCGKGSFSGRAWHAELYPEKLPPPGCVVILPDAGVRWLEVVSEVARHRSAVITETGGAVSHLVNVAREQEVRMVRVKNARSIYSDRWTEVTVNCDNGTANITPP